MSHSPLLNLPGPPQDLLDDIESALTKARGFVAAYDPELVVIFSPDHYNGFFYRTMPPFCIGTAAAGVGDYGTYAGPLNVPTGIATDCARAVLESGVDVAISASMDVDHGTVQPLQKLFDDAAARPVIPIFINSVATPLGPLRRVRALGAAVGTYLASLGQRVLIIGSGGLSHDPPVPTLATAPPAALGRIVHGNPMTPEQRQARQVAVMDAAREFADGRGPLQPLNPDWDNGFLELLDEIRQRLNLAVLFITHDLRVAAQICDYVAVMSKGRVVEYGSAEQVFGAPTHEYTKSLFAAAPGREWEFGKFAA